MEAQIALKGDIEKKLQKKRSISRKKKTNLQVILDTFKKTRS